MKVVDVIMISRATTPALYKITQDALDSLHGSSQYFHFNVIVYEHYFGIGTDGKIYSYEYPDEKVFGYNGAVTLMQDSKEPFNYNALMNKGTELGNADWVIWCNNDVLFSQGFMEAIEKESEPAACSSWCCLEPTVSGPPEDKYEYGYEIRKHILGWAIIARRRLWRIIGGLDTSHAFWFSDNMYAQQLQEYGLNHALLKNVSITHLHSQTLRTLPYNEILNLTEGYEPIL